jgi:hypothetical protein
MEEVIISFQEDILRNKATKFLAGALKRAGVSQKKI